MGTQCEQIVLGPFDGAASDEVLALAADALERLSARAGWSTKLLFQANLVLEELAMNVLTHGAPARALTIRVTAGREVEIAVADAGAPFDPVGQAPEAPAAAEGDAAPVGGLGLKLVREIAARMTYARREGRNHVVVTLKGHEDQGGR